MSETSTRLVYFVGGLADITSEERDPFRKLYDHLPYESEHCPTRKTVEPIKRVHSFRQSTVIPYPWRLKLIERAKPRSENPDKSEIPLFTDQSAEDLANQLDLDIQMVSREVNAKEIILIAYSSGSAIVRRALLLAKERELEREKLTAIDLLSKPRSKRFQVEPWSKHLSTIIHIGGMTMGWEFNSQMPKLYLWLGPIFRPLCPYWFIWQLYRGSKFITDTRIGLNRHPRPETHQTFYILGTQDQFLSPGDAVEPGEKGEEKNPIYLEVTGFDHNSILRIKDEDEKKGSRLNEILTRIIDTDKNSRPGIIDGLAKDKLARHIPQSDIDDYLDPMDNEPAKRMDDVEHVVIVLHGIRDSGFWAKRIAHRIKEMNRSANPPEDKRNKIKVVSLSYGYFSLWDFLRPGGRRQAVEWFQNVYADITALYPNADVSFIGHSNGTYLGTHALQCEYVNYRYLVLAGSVVRRDFWDTKGKEWQWKRKVMRLLNMRGVDDWIVGLLPGGLETIPIVGKWMDLGGLGAYGNPWLKEDKEQIKLVGDHGAGIVDKGWDNLAEFVLDQEPVTARLSLFEVSGKPPGPRPPQSIFNVVENDEQLRNNNFFRYIRAFFLGFYIYLAILISFSPLLQLLWAGFFAHFPNFWSPTNTLGATTGTIGLILLNLHTLLKPQHLWQALSSWFGLPSLEFSLGTNGLALGLLAPLSLLVLIALLGNILITLKDYLKMTRQCSFERRRSRISSQQKKILLSMIAFPALALLVLKGIVFLLQDAQTTMALLIILSILSFSLLKRI
jgi:hypothetical protein